MTTCCAALLSPGCWLQVRVSAVHYNTMRDVEQLLEALETVLF